MKILVAPDKFKHSLNSFEACEAIRSGILKASADCNAMILPLADGGDGLSEVIRHYTPSNLHVVNVSDPLFRQIKSSLLLSEDKTTAYIEMAKASGLQLLKPKEYNCMYTTTLGTGELIKEAIALGNKKIIIGLGGSATNDCGIGMAVALGYRFLDKVGNAVKPIAKNLHLIERIDRSNAIDTEAIQFTVACDVSNPLTGPNGATMVYASQKGASENDLQYMESGITHFAGIIEKDLGLSLDAVAGAGAAGGLGAACIAFLNARLESGIEMVLKISEAERHIKEADVVFTGEGKIDIQSLSGKLLTGISNLCKKHNKPLIAFFGQIELSNTQLENAHITAIPINPEGIPITDAHVHAYKLLKEAACKAAGSVITF